MHSYYELKKMGVKRLLKANGRRNRGLWIYTRAIKMYSRRTKNNTNIKHMEERRKDRNNVKWAKLSFFLSSYD